MYSSDRAFLVGASNDKESVHKKEIEERRNPGVVLEDRAVPAQSLDLIERPRATFRQSCRIQARSSQYDIVKNPLSNLLFMRRSTENSFFQKVDKVFHTFFIEFSHN